MKTLIFLILIFSSVDAIACRVKNISIEDKTANSTQIYIGRVISIAVPELETVPYPKNLNNDFVITSRVNKEATLVVYKTVKGTDLKRITIPINWCGGGEVRLGSVGIIHNLNDNWFISYSIDEIENAESH